MTSMMHDPLMRSALYALCGLAFAAGLLVR
jgi:hypothetical protein